VHVSKQLKEGSVYDKSHWNSDRIVKKLQEKYPLGQVEDEGKVCGDKQFGKSNHVQFFLALHIFKKHCIA
jgi:hypothetical protein